MSDIALTWSLVDGAADFGVEANDLETTDDLETAISISLFVDRRAEDGDILPDAEIDRRGWWGDALPVVENDKIGSRLWLLARAKQVPETLTLAADFAREATAWMIEDKVLDRIEVATEFSSLGWLAIELILYRPKLDPVNFRYNYAWATQEARRAA